MKEIIQKFQKSPHDTGSSEVQVIRLTEGIRSLSDHMKTHPKDFHSRRGLMRSINQRKSLLAYLKRSMPARYLELIQALGLRH